VKVTTWTPPVKAWRRACDSAGGTLYIRVLGVDRDLPRGSPHRKTYSQVVQVTPQN
jgi:hypothetical protein